MRRWSEVQVLGMEQHENTFVIPAKNRPFLWAAPSFFQEEFSRIAIGEAFRHPYPSVSAEPALNRAVHDGVFLVDDLLSLHKSIADEAYLPLRSSAR